MNGRWDSVAWIEQLQHAVSGPLPAIVALGFSALLLFALLTLVARNRSLRLQLAGHGSRVEMNVSPPAGAPLAEPGAGTDIVRTPIDRLLPRHPLPLYLFALAISAAFWALGLALAPDKTRFLQSPEWHIQPFYLALAEQHVNHTSARDAKHHEDLSGGSCARWRYAGSARR